jgi:nucleoside-diphosphate-sugar epimerase
MDGPKTILIAGITGFIGSALARRLVEQGIHVYGLKRETSRLDRLAGVTGLSLHDLRDGSVAELRRVIDECRPEVVFNLAAHGVSSGDVDPFQTYQVNVEFAVNMVHAVASHPATGLIHVGSCFEYGA